METRLSLLDQAIIFATNAHQGGFRRDGHTPYILHCTETAAITATMTADETVLAAAVLHDVIEDTDTTEEALRATFGETVTSLVLCLSENKRSELPPEDTWLIRKEETIDALEESDDIRVKQICLGDKLSNLRGIYRDYLRQGEDIWEGFHQKSRAKQGWYYYQLECALDALSDTHAFQEFHDLRLRIFEQ